MSPVVAQVESSCLHHTSSNSVTITAPLSFGRGDRNGSTSQPTPGSQRRRIPGSARSVSAMTPGGSGNGYGAGSLGSAFRYKTPGRKTQRGGVLTAGRDEAIGSAWRTPLRPKPRTFSFDHVLGADAKQESVFNCVAPLIDCVATGDRNATILASGATGCGKTHTILRHGQSTWCASRAVKRMFHVLRATTKEGQEGQTGTYTVSLSYVELYRNRFVDLLAPPEPAFAGTAFGSFSSRKSSRSSRSSIDLHETRNRGIYLSGSDTLHSPVTSVDDALRLIRMGNKNRATSATNANEHSSRSHAIVTLHIEVTSTEGQSNITSTTKKKQARFARRGPRYSKLHIIDLASERASQSGAAGVQLQEAGNQLEPDGTIECPHGPLKTAERQPATWQQFQLKQQQPMACTIPQLKAHTSPEGLAWWNRPHYIYCSRPNRSRTVPTNHAHSRLCSPRENYP